MTALALCLGRLIERALFFTAALLPGISAGDEDDSTKEGNKAQSATTHAEVVTMSRGVATTRHVQSTWLRDDETEERLQINLDGEPLTGTRFRFEILPRRLSMNGPPARH